MSQSRLMVNWPKRDSQAASVRLICQRGERIDLAIRLGQAVLSRLDPDDLDFYRAAVRLDHRSQHHLAADSRQELDAVASLPMR